MTSKTTRSAVMSPTSHCGNTEVPLPRYTVVPEIMVPAQSLADFSTPRNWEQCRCPQDSEFPVALRLMTQALEWVASYEDWISDRYGAEERVAAGS